MDGLVLSGADIRAKLGSPRREVNMVFFFQGLPIFEIGSCFLVLECVNPVKKD
jgi:hypothetical protein